MSEVDRRSMKRSKSAIDQGQKDYYLREKMNAIREELGDIGSQDQDAEKIS